MRYYSIEEFKDIEDRIKYTEQRIKKLELRYHKHIKKGNLKMCLIQLKQIKANYIWLHMEYKTLLEAQIKL